MAMPDNLVQITLYTDKETKKNLGRVSTCLTDDGYETLVTSPEARDLEDIVITYDNLEQARGGHKAIVGLMQWAFPGVCDVSHLFGSGLG